MSRRSEIAISIKQLRAIVAIGQQASLVRASQQLSISQSSLSRQIAEVEEVLGHKLFQRGWNGMEPTSFGTIAISHARRMMALLHQASTCLNDLGARTGDLSYHVSWFMLDVVDAVLATGSASAAAEDLAVSQPTVSRTLAQVSAAIGDAPFVRTATGMAATGYAPILARLGHDLRFEALQMIDELGELSGQLTGRVAVGLLPFSEQDVVVEAFSILMRDHSHLRLQAVTGSYAALTNALRRGEIDLVLGPLRDLPQGDPLRELPLLDEHLTVVARPGHPLAKGHVDLASLIAQAWVVGPHGTPTRLFFEGFLIEQGMSLPAQICEMVTFPLAEKLVLESDALGLLSYSTRQLLRLHDRLAVVSTDFPAAVRKIGVTWPVAHAPSPAQVLFLDVLKSCLPDQD